MATTSIQQRPCVLYTLLPGPSRKRRETTYCYRLTYRNADETAAGCVMLWEISGGRLSYQIAVERDEKGRLHLHCTCADAIYRAEEEGRHCKHIHGLLSFASSGQPLLEPSPEVMPLWPPSSRPLPPEMGEVA